MTMHNLIEAAAGRCPADFVIRGARVANVFTLEYEELDVAVYGGKVAGLGSGYEGKKYIDADGAVLIPGMIDGHIHIESSMLSPPAFADAVVPFGTTTVMADPHEIANVMGMGGIEYMYMASQGLPVDIFLGAPSCVPASEFESPHEKLGIMSVRDMFRHGWTHHLGEVMDYISVLNGDPEMLGKIAAAGDVVLTGHAPGLRGKDLNAYIVTGVLSDHECTNIEEAHEKLRRGMWLMMREGTSFRNLSTFLPLIKEHRMLASRCMVVTDDMTARYLINTGHMDSKVRLMIKEGVDPLTALRMVTRTPADYFMLHDRGAIIPGYRADMALVDSLESFKVHKVWKNGVLVAEEGSLITPRDMMKMPIPAFRRIDPPRLEQIEVPAEGDTINIIGMNEGEANTRRLQVAALVRDGKVCADPSRDIAKIVVVERHNATGRIGVGFVTGFGIRKGAIASSVSHDAHNFVAVGADDRSIITALTRLCDGGGGLTVAEGDELRGMMALPIAGLMTNFDARTAAHALDNLDWQAKTLGVHSDHPFILMSFMCLSVIPELRITDRGYVSPVDGIVPLFA